MKRLSVRLLLLSTVMLLFGVLLLHGRSYASTGVEAIEDQVAALLYEESGQGKIKVVILDFGVSSAPGAGQLSDKESKDLSTRFTEEFTADIMKKIKESGKRERIAIIDRGRLDDVLRERKQQTTDGSERMAIDIGRSAGVDVVIAGRLQAAGNEVSATVKVVRVKDGEILDIIKQDKQKKSSPPAHAPIALLEIDEKLVIGAYKAFSLNLQSGGTLNVTVDVINGNPVDVTVIPGSELENYKERKEFKKVALFTATKTKSYKRSADLDSGDYYLIVHDGALGVFSAQSSNIRIQVLLAE